MSVFKIMKNKIRILDKEIKIGHVKDGIIMYRYIDARDKKVTVNVPTAPYILVNFPNIPTVEESGTDGEKAYFGFYFGTPSQIINELKGYVENKEDLTDFGPVIGCKEYISSNVVSIGGSWAPSGPCKHSRIYELNVHNAHFVVWNAPLKYSFKGREIEDIQRKVFGMGSFGKVQSSPFHAIPFFNKLELYNTEAIVGKYIIEG